MTLRPDFTVADLGELVLLHVAELEEGANAWVETEGDYWTLEKASGAAVGPDVVAPIAGSPRAGASNARWLRATGILASNVGYTATGGAGVWGATLPTNEQSATDRIAAAVAGLLGGPIP